MELPIFLAAFAAALLAASIGLVALWVLPGRDTQVATTVFTEADSGTLWLFDGETLLDCTPDGRALLSASLQPGSQWQKLLAFLAPKFHELEARLQRLHEEGALELAAEPGAPALMLRASVRGGITKVELLSRASARQNSQNSLAQDAATEEIEALREAMAAAPMLAWRENQAGDVIWANGPYLLQSCAVLSEGKELGWPLPKLFVRASLKQDQPDHRQSLALPSGKQAWFNISTKTEESGWLRYAVPADAAVQAEVSLREFMQTLTKTFAQLPIGLAIFDATRKLQLFNPALLDLTHLPADFLSMRPTLLSVLDAMRDRKMLPEPKDYRNWRQQLVEMEKAAASGLYEETWSLADGQTYRVIGRPHPNGALALMIEDISSEMLRSRRFRSDMELSQAVVDQFEDAIAVFDQGGQLVMSNAAYSTLWGHDPSESFGDCTLRHLTNHWRTMVAPSGLWAELEEYIATIGDRECWQGEARFLDGRLILCRFAPLAGGSTLARFGVQQQRETLRPKLAQGQKRSSA